MLGTILKHENKDYKIKEEIKPEVYPKITEHYNKNNKYKVKIYFIAEGKRGALKSGYITEANQIVFF
jgi:hypothetical protein